jgi:GDP-L-fucose synthase
LLASELYDGPEPVNLGSGMEISIKDLANKIIKLSEFEGRVVWDTSKPNGQPRRSLDTTRAEEYFGFRAKKSFDEGLKETINWYRENKDSIA